MVGQQKKYRSGQAVYYIHRNACLKKLQLSLKAFRRLCILKGVYPHEPKSFKKAGRGNASRRSYYLRKDIRFLMHEPIIEKFRAHKIHLRKMQHYYNKGDLDAVRRRKRQEPIVTLHHIVKERYPTFVDALRDLDDALTLVFLFAVFPVTKITDTKVVQLCRKLAVEFMHYVIASKSLRKVYVSIKGIYYQADIQGETITWVDSHKFPLKHSHEVDYRIMRTFIDFYTSLLGFTVYKLYADQGMVYPPQLAMESEATADLSEYTPDELKSERLSALTQQLSSIQRDPSEEDIQMDEFASGSGEPEDMEVAKLRQEAIRQLQSLFAGLKFFLGREVNRESLTFVIRSFDGQVSWCSTQALGYSYQEDDETITHQVVDRTKTDKKYLSRYYIQPQWVYDCVNAKKLLPVSSYFPEVALPPHLSPFVEGGENQYQPPEARGEHAQDDDDNEKEEQDEEMSEEEILEELSEGEELHLRHDSDSDTSDFDDDEEDDEEESSDKQTKTDNRKQRPKQKQTTEEDEEDEDMSDLESLESMDEEELENIMNLGDQGDGKKQQKGGDDEEEEEDGSEGEMDEEGESSDDIGSSNSDSDNQQSEQKKKKKKQNRKKKSKKPPPVCIKFEVGHKTTEDKQRMMFVQGPQGKDLTEVINKAVFTVEGKKHEVTEFPFEINATCKKEDQKASVQLEFNDEALKQTVTYNYTLPGSQTKPAKGAKKGPRATSTAEQGMKKEKHIFSKPRRRFHNRLVEAGGMRMNVSTGQLPKVDCERRLEEIVKENLRLQEMMIPKKQKKIYDKIKNKRRKEANEIRVLESKRKAYDEEQRELKRKKTKAKQ